MEFIDIIEKYRNIVDAEIGKFFDAKIAALQDDFLRESYGHLKEFVLGPGKRLRPVSMIMAFSAVNGSGGEKEEMAYPLSIVPEMVHCSTLIHDDLIDEDKIRRHKPTMHKLFEQKFREKFNDRHHYGDLFSSHSKRFAVSMAMLQGNILNSMVSSCIMESGLKESLKNKAVRMFNGAYSKTNEGQMLDLAISEKDIVAEEEYMRMASAKTASLFSASLKFGAMMNNARPSQLDALGNYSNAVALAFQIQDDIMDIIREMEKGRAIGTDIRKGNKTLITVYALEKSSEDDKKALLGVLGSSASEKDMEKAIEIIKASGALEYAANYANELAKAAKEHLKKAKLNEQGHKFFEDFAEFAVKRKS